LAATATGPGKDVEQGNVLAEPRHQADSRPLDRSYFPAYLDAGPHRAARPGLSCGIRPPMK
jgi:hypothetical protein